MLNDLPLFLSYKDAKIIKMLKLYKKVIKTTFLLIVYKKIEIVSRKKVVNVNIECYKYFIVKMLYKCYYRN